MTKRLSFDVNKLAKEAGFGETGDLEDEIFDDKDEQLPEGGGLNNIKEKIYETDPFQKALTGRTPERIEEEIGFAKETIFPKGAKIIYVGDPWQRMGKEIDDPSLTVIDYEFGEVISFITEDERFRDKIISRAENLLEIIKSLIQYLEGKDKQWLLSFHSLIEKAYELSVSVSDIKDYPRVAAAW